VQGSNAAGEAEMGIPSSGWKSIVWTAGNTLVLTYTFLPLAWIVSLSLKPAADLNDRRFFPRAISLDNYRAVFNDPQFPAALANSLGIGLITSVLAVLLAMLAAYALIRLEFAGKRLVQAAALAVAMFPPISIVGPLFDLWRIAGLFDTWMGLVLPYLSFSLPLSIWTLSAFFREIPWDLEKAARVDGATRFQALRMIIVPLAAPGVFTTALLVFIFAWNDFLFAASLTSTNNARTVPAAIAFFTGASRFEQPIGSLAAASVVVSLPVVILVLVLQRRIVAGLTAGAVKG
jgi:multiple sugar transport system permease protein